MPLDAEPQMPDQGETSEAPATEVTRAQLSRILGCNIRTVSKLEADGIFAPSERGRGGKASVFILEDVVPKYVRYVIGVKPAGEDARSRRDKSQAELNELRLAQQRGELVPREQVVSEYRTVADRSAKEFRSLGRWQVQEGLIAPEDRPRVEAKTEEIIAALYDLKTYLEPQQ